MWITRSRWCLFRPYWSMCLGTVLVAHAHKKHVITEPLKTPGSPSELDLTVIGSNLWCNRMLRQSATYGTKYRQIVHKSTRTDINFKTLQAAVFNACFNVHLIFFNNAKTRGLFLNYTVCSGLLLDSVSSLFC